MVEALTTEPEIDDLAVVATAISDVSMYCEILLDIPEIKLFAAQVAHIATLQATHLLSAIKSRFYVCLELRFAVSGLAILPAVGVLTITAVISATVTDIRRGLAAIFAAATLVGVIRVGGDIGVRLGGLGWMGIDAPASLDRKSVV